MSRPTPFRTRAASLVLALSLASACDDGGEAVTPEGDELWVVGGWVTNPDDSYTGYLHVVDDLTSAGSVDLSQVTSIPSDMVYASPGNGKIYVGVASSPVIERWGLDENRVLVKEDTVSFATYGVTRTFGGNRNVIQFLSEDVAYYFDRDTLQVIVFDPSDTMTALRAFSIDGLAVDGLGQALNYIHRDGDRFIISARYWGEVDEMTTQIARAAIIDSTTETVSYIEDTRCGDVAFNVTDADGNLYLGSHPGHAAWMAAGADTNFPQCILRINKGESAFDPSYFVNLTDLGVVGGLLQGVGNQAYVFKYDGPAITTAPEARAATRGSDWAVYGLQLGTTTPTLVAVPGASGITMYGSAFATVIDGTPTAFLVTVNADFGAGRYWNITDPANVIPALQFTGGPGPAIRVQ